MSAERTLYVYVKAWRDTAWLSRSPVVLAPFVVLAILKAIPYLLIVHFNAPGISGFMVPVMHAVFGEAALHYPSHVIMVPDMFRGVDIAVGLLFGLVLAGLATFMIVDALEHQHVRRGGLGLPFVIAMPSLLAIGVLFVLSIQGVSMLVDWLDGITEHARLSQLIVLSGTALQILALSVILYSVCFLRYFRDGARAALKRSARFVRRRFVLTVMVVGTAALIIVPADFFMGMVTAPTLYAGEGLTVAVVTRLVLETLAAFYLFAAAASIALGGRKIR